MCVNYACVHGWSFIRGHVKVDKYLSAWNITAESPCPVVPKRCSTCAWVMCHGWRERRGRQFQKNNSIISVTWNSQGGKSCTCETGIKLWCGSMVTEQRAERPMVILATPLIWNHITQSLVRPCWGQHILLCSSCTFLRTRQRFLKSVRNLMYWWYCIRSTTSSSSNSGCSCTSSCSSTTAKVLHASDRLGLTHQVDSIEQCWNIKGWSFIYTLTGAFTPCHKTKSVKGSLHLQSSFENHFIFQGVFEEFGSKTDFFFFYTRQRVDKSRERSSKTSANRHPGWRCWTYHH